MKRFFAFLAAALLVVACGGTKEKSNAIEDQLLDYVAKIEKAVEAGDAEAAVEALFAWEEWRSSLDEQQYAEYETFVDKHLDRIDDMYASIGVPGYDDTWDDEDYDDEDYDDAWDDEDYDDEDYEDYDDEDYDDEDYDDEW